MSLPTETTTPSSSYKDLLGSESSESRGKKGQDSEFLFANRGLVHSRCVLSVTELLYLGVDCWKPKGSPADTPWASTFYLPLHRKVSLMARVVVPPPLAPPQGFRKTPQHSPQHLAFCPHEGARSTPQITCHCPPEVFSKET